jgi:hypothetical protein
MWQAPCNTQEGCTAKHLQSGGLHTARDSNQRCVASSCGVKRAALRAAPSVADPKLFRRRPRRVPPAAKGPVCSYSTQSCEVRMYRAIATR